MALQFHGHTTVAKDLPQIAGMSFCSGFITAGEGSADRAFFIACEAKKAVCVGCEFCPGDAAFVFSRTQFGGGEHAAEVLVTAAATH